MNKFQMERFPFYSVTTTNINTRIEIEESFYLIREKI